MCIVLYDQLDPLLLFSGDAFPDFFRCSAGLFPIRVAAPRLILNKQNQLLTTALHHSSFFPLLFFLTH